MGACGDERRRCMRWLEMKEEESVVFVCFWSWCYFADEQLRESALGLVASGKPFLWVVRGSGGGEWMPEGWERRVEGRGMVVFRWAPQAAILAQPAVGAFLSHCGWSSMLERAAGVLILTWQLVFEQFINEWLVVDVVGAGAPVWDGFRSTVEADWVVVSAEAVRRAVARFMEGGGEEVRAWARELAAKAKSAMARFTEGGGGGGKGGGGNAEVVGGDGGRGGGVGEEAGEGQGGGAEGRGEGEGLGGEVEDNGI